ncbi:DNA-methyltransferase [Bacillus thuringiensis]|uniref:Methyltransferase n=1 Tax=Bacillus thuringiensis TaxID=1428 RepID=A0ABD6R5E8_BACTU|nr:site-specific DNA-methyltransferase [Bacillus thuringiensis]OPD49312.1 site-specific DNA-methyltransferase [Bacillus thuringiensis]
MANINKEFINIKQFNQYITGNSTDILSFLPENIEPFIDLIVTSPPYWDMKQYGDVQQTGFKQTYEEYLDDIESTFDTLYKLSKNTATLYVNSDTLKRNGQLIRLPDDIAKRLENVGWIHQDVIIWDKGKTLPWSRKGQMRNTFEYIHMFTKSKSYKYYIERIKTVDELKEWWVDYPERYSPEGKVPDNIWEFIIPTQGSWGTKKDFGEKEFKHACPFPPEMMARIIKLSSDEGDIIFDPYAGTGVLLATAELLNRRYLGFDTNPEYKQIFEHVTQPLITEQIKEINKYYEQQKNLKILLTNAIYKLRILKFPKSMIKKIIKLSDPNEKNVVRPFVAAFAIEENMENGEEEKFKIGKASYYFVLNDNFNNTKEIHLMLKDFNIKAPFSKYGLKTQVHLITVKDAIDLFKSYQNNLYLYSNGIVNNLNEKISINEIIDLIQNRKTNSKLNYKQFPPIFSNISIKLSDYEEILPEKYNKKE